MKSANHIEEIRRSKGLTQKDLADLASVELGVVKQMESGKIKLNSHTFRRICHALGVQVEELFELQKRENNNYIVMMYLSILTFIVFPFGNISLPLILWINRKNRIRGVASHGKDILNFQLTWSILFYLSFVLYSIPKVYALNTHFTDFLEFKGLIPIWLLLGLINAVYAIVGSYLAIQGKRIYLVAIPFLRNS